MASLTVSAHSRTFSLLAACGEPHADHYLVAGEVLAVYPDTY